MVNVMTQEVTDVQMKKYAKLIYDTAGIQVSLQKKQLMSNRLRRRLKATGIDCFDKYIKHLKSLKPSNPEWDCFLQEITTHETYLFRDETHWKWLQQTFMPEFVKEVTHNKRQKNLRVWSAACSTGDEAHSIACCVLDGIGLQQGWEINIIGTDIGIGAVEKAREGVFNQRAMKLVPDVMKKRYFDRMGQVDVWQAKPTIKKLLNFKQHNLLNSLNERPFDLVFLKNVLIYFNTESKLTAIKHVSKLMKPGSYLVAGGAEGIGDMMQGYERLHPWLFRKQ
ncbi:MAG: histidine kinase [Blastopirellula sp.]|nr:MAG: histidine kinase [Blastopirellula sp.]